MSLVLKVLDYLYSHYQESQSLDSLAAQFFVSKATILYNFKRYLHTSPMDFLLNLRLEKAKEALETTNKSVCPNRRGVRLPLGQLFQLDFQAERAAFPPALPQAPAGQRIGLNIFPNLWYNVPVRTGQAAGWYGTPARLRGGDYGSHGGESPAFPGKSRNYCIMWRFFPPKLGTVPRTRKP